MEGKAAEGGKDEDEEPQHVFLDSVQLEMHDCGRVLQLSPSGYIFKMITANVLSSSIGE